MASSPRIKELQHEIWAALGEIVADRGRGDPLVDTTFWSDQDHRDYETALQKVKLHLERKAGTAPDPSDPGYKDWARGR